MPYRSTSWVMAAFSVTIQDSIHIVVEGGINGRAIPPNTFRYADEAFKFIREQIDQELRKLEREAS